MLNLVPMELATLAESLGWAPSEARLQGRVENFRKCKKTFFRQKCSGRSLFKASESFSTSRVLGMIVWIDLEVGTHGLTFANIPQLQSGFRVFFHDSQPGGSPHNAGPAD